METRILSIEANDLAKLSLRQQARIRRAANRQPYAGVWRMAGPQWVTYHRLRGVRERRGRLLVLLAKLKKRRRYGRLAKLAAALGVSRWTVWRDLRVLHRAHLIRRGRRQTETARAPAAPG